MIEDYVEFDKFLEILSLIRQEKSKAQKAMNAEIILTLSKEQKDSIKDLLTDLNNVVNAKELKEGENLEVEIV